MPRRGNNAAPPAVTTGLPITKLPDQKAVCGVSQCEGITGLTISSMTASRSAPSRETSGLCWVRHHNGIYRMNTISDTQGNPAFGIRSKKMVTAGIYATAPALHRRWRRTSSGGHQFRRVHHRRNRKVMSLIARPQFFHRVAANAVSGLLADCLPRDTLIHSRYCHQTPTIAKSS